MVTVKKISATLLDFGKPLLDMVPGKASMKTRREAIQIVITIWNCLVLEEAGDPNWLAELRALLEKGPPESRALMEGALDLLRLRKKLRHPNARLVVRKWELKDLGDGQVSLYAEAHAAPSGR